MKYPLIGHHIILTDFIIGVFFSNSSSNFDPSWGFHSSKSSPSSKCLVDFAISSQVFIFLTGCLLLQQLFLSEIQIYQAILLDN
jgi:hypothetical protein